MRSKEVEEAINQLIVDINFSETGCSTGIIDVKNIETILSYIEELEKRDKAVLVFFDKEGNPIEYLNKQVIRDKIKELEEAKDKEKYITDRYLIILGQIEVLKSIIGE